MKKHKDSAPVAVRKDGAPGATRKSSSPVALRSTIADKGQLKLALVGNPNSGKTTMFNALTGSMQYVGNWPGVTVEKKEARLRNGDALLCDLPGIYSLSPYTPEEIVTRDYLLLEKPDAVINLVDASNLERNLYLTYQLLETGIPVVIALNMMDMVRSSGDIIDIAKLSALLGCPVVPTTALRGEGLSEVAVEAVRAASRQNVARLCTFAPDTEAALGELERLICAFVPADLHHHYHHRHETHDIHEFHTHDLRSDTNIAGYHHEAHGGDASLVRFYAIKLLERDEDALRKLDLARDVMDIVNDIVKRIEAEKGDIGEAVIAGERYDYIVGVVEKCVKKKHPHTTMSDRIDRVVTSRVFALPVFAAVMFAVYYAAISSVGGLSVEWMEALFSWLGGLAADWLLSINAPAWVGSLLADALIGGVGAVLVYVPQMFVLFLMLAIFEDVGYMARVAFIMDRLFRRFGLSGKSVIPMLIASGCGVPAIMASRTIEHVKDRRMTAITATFIPCGAKLPIIALISAGLFGGAWWMAPCMYFLGIATVMLSGIMLKKTRLFVGKPAPFVMELPQYHVPDAHTVLSHAADRAKSFVKKAGTIIFLGCTVIWFLQSFGIDSGRLVMTNADVSLLAAFGGWLAPLFMPLGFGYWEAAVASLTGIVAKEQVVGTLGTLLSAQSGIASLLTPAGGIAFLIFNLICAPCVAAIGALRRELGARWCVFAVVYQTSLAYVLALAFYQLSMLVTRLV